MKSRGIRVLAISQNARGYGFVILEGPAAPVEWGTRRVPRSRKPLVEVTEELVAWYEPDVVVLEDGRGPGSRRGITVLKFLGEIRALVTSSRIPTHRYSRALVRECFAGFGAKTKEEIATVIARELPDLAPKLPPKRKPWKSEDERLSIFDAASLALTYFYRDSKEEGG